MSSDNVRLLHVEDDRIQQALAKQFLQALDEFRFDVTAVETESDAIAAFQQGGFDLVLLDYNLAEGNGLNCLRRLREIDAMVPIIAISGVATPEIAAELIMAGADDYLNKRSLNQMILGQSVRNVLARARAIKMRTCPSRPVAAT
jgi:two-component system cell cycle sensor histidine kinase/response regulator CckA